LFLSNGCNIICEKKDGKKKYLFKTAIGNIISYQLSVISYQLSVISYQLSITNHLLTNHLLTNHQSPMATILRPLSYKYQWLYDGISRLASLGVGGEKRFRHLALDGLNITPETEILDLCCGAGQTTRFLVELSDRVTGLDISPIALKRAAQSVPQAQYIEGAAEKMPLPDEHFDLVHTSVALHEMEPEQLQQILQEVDRVLKPGGIFAAIDFHKPTNGLFWLPLGVFLWLFETKTAWQLLETDLVEQLKLVGFSDCQQRLYAGGSLQAIQARK
jgi:demethylmenaquinone methyltransferase/2-methoxy-6-polyprenyl-1,4-benzoquinol methylase